MHSPCVIGRHRLAPLQLNTPTFVIGPASHTRAQPITTGTVHARTNTPPDFKPPFVTRPAIHGQASIQPVHSTGAKTAAPLAARHCQPPADQAITPAQPPGAAPPAAVGSTATSQPLAPGRPIAALAVLFLFAQENHNRTRRCHSDINAAIAPAIGRRASRFDTPRAPTRENDAMHARFDRSHSDREQYAPD